MWPVEGMGTVWLREKHHAIGSCRKLPPRHTKRQKEENVTSSSPFPTHC